MTNENYPSKSKALLPLVNVAVAVKIPLIQIREKELSARLLYEVTSTIVNITRSSNTRVLVNDRFDIAIAAGADGVHLPSNSIPVKVVRKHAPKDLLVGMSTHSIDDVSAAVGGGADFAVLGPIYESPKKGKSIGIKEFQKTVNSYQEFPILGLGGIDQSNYQEVLDTGAVGFAAIRFLNNISDLEILSRELGL